jgi:hypothetical protein
MSGHEAQIASPSPSQPEQVLMDSRSLPKITIALMAGFLVVASQAFSAEAYWWLSFSGGIAIGIIAVGFGPLRRRGIIQRGLDAAIDVLAASIIVSSVLFGPGTVVWLGSSAALAVLALAITGLIAIELATEQVVHSLEVGADRENTTNARAVIHA